MAKAFEEFCLQQGIRQTLNSVRHSQSNGLVELVNSTLDPVLQANMELDTGQNLGQESDG